MDDEKYYIELVEKARLGDRQALNRLTDEARVRLRSYVYRLTLQENLTQDIVQESLLEMLRIFKQLKRAESFWCWLYSIAQTKVRRHYGSRWRRGRVPLCDGDAALAGAGGSDVLADVVTNELKDIVAKSMAELQPRHRAVLSLRCYDGMGYSKIAKVLGCTQFGAQALFYRAKKSLAKKLSRYGLGKGSLLTALVVFGKLTAASEAAAANVSVTAATVKVGAAASVAAIATGRTVIVSTAAVGIIAAGTAVVPSLSDGVDVGPQKSRAESLIAAPRQGKAEAHAGQCWYFFPEGGDGAVMMRLMKPGGRESACRVLQNEHANYFFDKGSIFIRNNRWYNPDFSVRRLPTDGADLSESISRIQGRAGEMDYVSATSKGLLVITEEDGSEGRVSQTEHHVNVLEEEYFQIDWPGSTPIVDERDAMHKRGWTYFTVAGEIDGREITGTGQLPFVYMTSARHGPWMRLSIAGKRIADSSFIGFGRPWMGLHTIDTVRRDAAKEGLDFETKYTPDGSKAEVVVKAAQGEIVYAIDMVGDVVERITVSTNDGRGGELKFSYLQEIGDGGGDFAEPRTGGRTRRRENLSAGWLLELAAEKAEQPQRH